VALGSLRTRRVVSAGADLVFVADVFVIVVDVAAAVAAATLIIIPAYTVLLFLSLIN
jgi:hypothetical protein